MLFRRYLLDLVLCYDNILILVILKTFYDVFRLQFLAAMAASFSISDAGMILIMELIETDIVVLRGGIARIRTFGTGDNNYAEVQFEQSGSIRVNMLQLYELGAEKKPAPADKAKAADPDAVDLHEWYDLSASSAIRATIDEVYTRGYKTLYIGESGEVYVKENDQNVKQGKLSFMPGKKLWPDLVPCFADDDIIATVGDDEMTLTWA